MLFVRSPWAPAFLRGGDEFVLLMPETDAAAALAQATKVLETLMATRFEMKNGLGLRVCASIGLASAPDDGETLHAIIGAADARMYMVKSNGRGQIKGA